MKVSIKTLLFFSSTAILLIVFISSSCSLLDKPSATDGKNLVKKLIQENSNGTLKLISFEKLNGEERTNSEGEHIYTMLYKAQIEILETKYCWGFNSSVYNAPGLQTNVEEFRPILKCVPDLGDKPEKKGEVYTIIRTLAWKKTDNGWVFDSSCVY